MELLPHWIISIIIRTKHNKAVYENKKAFESINAYDVFISYCHKDKMKAKELFYLLTNDLKLKVWMDNKGGIGIGNDFGSEITKDLKFSKCIICLISEPYLKSENCIREIKLASHFKKKYF